MQFENRNGGEMVNANQEQALLIKRHDAAAMLGVSLRTFDNLIANKQISIRRIGRRVLVERKTLENFARKDHETKAGR